MTNKIFYIAIVLAILIIGGLSLGYRIQPNFSISRNAEIVMTIPLKNTEVFVGEKKVMTTVEENEEVRLSLSLKKHTISINREGYFPWTEEVTLDKSNVNSSKIIYPVFVTSNATGMIITNNDPEYWRIRNEIINKQVPNENAPVATSTSSLWLSLDNAIRFRSEGSVEENIVLTPNTPVRSLDFYKGRTDYILFASDVGVYLIEIDKNSGVQNFYPIYKGQSPKFIVNDNNSIFVLDGANLLAVVI